MLIILSSSFFCTCLKNMTFIQSTHNCNAVYSFIQMKLFFFFEEYEIVIQWLKSLVIMFLQIDRKELFLFTENLLMTVVTKLSLMLRKHTNTYMHKFGMTMELIFNVLFLLITCKLTKYLLMPLMVGSLKFIENQNILFVSLLKSFGIYSISKVRK